MLTTGNLGLKKPEGTDTVNIDDLNSNMDTLDVEVVKKASASTDGRMSKEDKSKLDGIESNAEVNNISDANATDLTDGGNSVLHYHTSDRERSNHTGTQLAASISNFTATVRSTVLTGLSTATNSAITATDNILSALGKLQAQINNKANNSHTHDSRYYTESEINTQMAGKSNTSHNHSGVYEPVISKNTGFNLNKSDSVTSTSSAVLATSKAAKTAYDKGVQALNTANAKLNSSGGIVTGNLSVQGDLTLSSNNIIRGSETNDYIKFNPTTDGVELYANDAKTLEVSGSVLKYEGNSIWHAGNDGSGTGLDSDKLDGAHKDTDGTLSGNSDNSIPTEKAVKTYVDNKVTSFRGALVNKTIAQSSATIITYDTVVYDTDSFYSASNPSRLTIPSGVSRVRLLAEVNLSNSLSQGVSIIKNGADFVGYPKFDYLESDKINLTSATISVSAGDYFEVKLETAQNVDSTNYSNWFSVEVVE